MSLSIEKFAQLLSEGVHRIRLREAKTIQAIQDELGYALGRAGGSSIEYWRKGHLPPNLTDVEKLARELVRRGGLERGWLEQFLVSAEHPYPGQLAEEIFNPARSKPGRPATPPLEPPPGFDVPRLVADQSALAALMEGGQDIVTRFNETMARVNHCGVVIEPRPWQ
nr:hypothetical protein [Anaerolineae bacterium]